MLQKIRIKLRSGSMMISFVFTFIGLLSAFILIMGTTTLYFNIRMMDDLVQSIGRKVVVCENMDDAYEKAEEALDEAVGNLNSLSQPELKIKYSEGQEKKEWRKGTFLDVSISAKMKSISPISNRRRGTSIMVMIEHTDPDLPEEE